MKNPTPRTKMLDGFNEGWIEFEGGEAGSRKGKVAMEAVLQTLIELRWSRDPRDSRSVAGGDVSAARRGIAGQPALAPADA
jgi:hypothetical protein